MVIYSIPLEKQLPTARSPPLHKFVRGIANKFRFIFDINFIGMVAFEWSKSDKYAGAGRDIVKVVTSQCRFTFTNFTFCILYTQVGKDSDIMCPGLYFSNVYKRMVYIEGLFMPEHWCSLLISLSFSYSYNFMYTKGITFNSGFYFTTISIYSCWLDTSSNKSSVFSTAHSPGAKRD